MTSNIKNLKETALRTIKKHELLTAGMHVVIGFSGGPDSLCLFDLLLSLKDEYKLSLYPVHINHNLRSEASDRDESFCRRFSATQGLSCDVYSFDCEGLAKERGITTEEAGRLFRYESYLKTVSRILDKNPEADIVIAVAQNADDKAETVLMRILRGTGVDGLSGVPYRRSIEAADGRVFFVVRPLLDVFKKDIIKYLMDRDIKPCIDYTNEEPIYNRNKIRLELIPELERKYNPSIKEALLRLASSAEEDRDFMGEVSRMVYEHAILESANEEKKKYVSLDLNSIKDGHPAIRRRVLAKAIKTAGLMEDVGSSHYNAIVELMLSENPSGMTNLPREYSAWRVYDELRIGIRDDSEETVKKELKFKVREITAKEFKESNFSPNTFVAFDLDLMKNEFGEDVLSRLILRERLPGDEIKLSVGNKKIQDLLVDMKVPKEDRKKIRVLALGNEVLWVVPMGLDIKPRYTSRWKITNETREIAYIVLFV